MNIAFEWIRRLIFGLLGLILIIVVLVLIFGWLILLIPVLLLVIAIGLLVRFFRNASTFGKKKAKKEKGYIDVEYKEEK